MKRQEKVEGEEGGVDEEREVAWMRMQEEGRGGGEGVVADERVVAGDGWALCLLKPRLRFCAL